MDDLISYYKTRTLEARAAFQNSIIRGYFVNILRKCLREHSSHNRIVVSNHTRVHRVGIEGEYMMALRVPWGNEFELEPERSTREEVETYARNAARFTSNEERSSSFCLPLTYSVQIGGEKETWYALLCEDLTAWGKYKLIPESRAERTKMKRHNLKGEYVDTVLVDLGHRSYVGNVAKESIFTDPNTCLDLKDEIIVN